MLLNQINWLEIGIINRDFYFWHIE